MSATDGGSSAAEGRARALGVWSLLALGINGIVGVGIFFTPSLVAALVPGLAGVLAYGLTALALLPVALTYARLGSRFDRDGGPYVWARAAFGEHAAFFVGFAAYASAVLSTAAVIAGLGEYTAPILGWSSQPRLFAALCGLVFGAITLSGLKPSAWVWSSLTVLKLVPLLLLMLAFSLSDHTPILAVANRHSSSWSRAILLILFTMQGFEIVPVPGSHVRSAASAIPIATIFSLVLCAGLYALLHWACVQSVPELAGQKAPLIVAARALGGARLAELVFVGTNVSALGIAFGMMAMTPRYLAVLEADRGRASLFAAETSEQVPRRALFMTVVLVVLLVSVGALSRLFVLSSVAVLLQYSVTVLSLARISWQRKHGLTRRDAWPTPFALCAIVIIARAVERTEVLVMAGILALALFLWLARIKALP